MLLPHFQPLALGRTRDPFSHRDWLFEIKWDGFRALAHVEHGRCKLISRNGNQFKSFSSLTENLPKQLRCESAVLDGEIVCVDDNGRTQFRDLLFRRGEPRFYAFDLLSHKGRDLRFLPLLDRKQRLRSVLPQIGEHVLYCDHVEAEGEALFRLACESDLEGIVAKPKYSPYLPEHANWMKIRNLDYSQWVGREELFERERGSHPDLTVWDQCVLACPE